MLFRIPSGRYVVCFVFDQSIAASDNRLSYACILLFPKSTKYFWGPQFAPQNDRVLRAEGNHIKKKRARYFTSI